MSVPDGADAAEDQDPSGVDHDHVLGGGLVIVIGRGMPPVAIALRLEACPVDEGVTSLN